MKNILLIDTENIGEKEYEYMINLKNFKLIFFETKATVNRKMPLSTAIKLTKAKINFEFLKVETSGKNALDFQICAYAGKFNKKNTRIFILSNDKGFDNLNSMNIKRIGTLKNISILKNKNIFKRLIEKINYFIDSKFLNYSKTEKKYYKKISVIVSEVCEEYVNDNDFIKSLFEAVKQNNNTLLNNALQNKIRSSNPLAQKELFKKLSRFSYELSKNNNIFLKEIEPKVKNIVSNNCNQYLDDYEFINNIVYGVNKKDVTFVNNIIQKKFRSSNPSIEKQLLVSLREVM